MLAPIIAGLAIGGYVLYMFSGKKDWKQKKVGPGTYNVRAQVSPPNTASRLTTEQFRAWLSEDPSYHVMMAHYVPETGELRTMLHYPTETTIDRVLTGRVPGTQLPLAIEIQSIERVKDDDGKQYPQMPVQLQPGAEPYLPPVQAPDNLRNTFANALASGNPDAMLSTADTFRQLGWPGLAGPLESRAKQLGA